MMPAYPVPHLIVRQASFPFGSLDTLFDAMSRLGHPGEFLQRHAGGRIGQIIINLVCVIRLTFASHKQHLVRTGATFLGPCLNPTFHGFDHQRPFLPVTHIDRDPAILRLFLAPSVYPYERTARTWSSSRVLRWWCLEVANERVRGNRQQIPLAEVTQFQPKTRGTAHFVVTRDPSVWQYPSAFLQHLQRQLMASTKLDRSGHPRFRTTPTVFGPLLRKIRVADTQGCRHPGSAGSMMERTTR